MSGRPKIGSTADASGAALPYQASASVVQSASIPRPEIPAMTSEAMRPIRRRTGSTGRRNGWPLIRNGLESSASRAGLSARNEPYRMRNVTTENPLKTTLCTFSVVQKTSLKPSDPNQRDSTK